MPRQRPGAPRHDRPLMTDPSQTAQARAWFAEDIRAVAPVVHDPRVAGAFAAVPRERHLGPGPWRLHARLDFRASHQSASDDSRHLYHDTLVSIDAASGINNGLPSLWALVLDHLAVAPGATVLQVGAGVGYYTAILAELVTERGRVVAYEVEAPLAARARDALAGYPQVEVVPGDAMAAGDLPALDVVVACAGVTHAPRPILDRLSEGGRMVLPLTGADSSGMLMHLTRDGDALPIRSLGPCSFYPCHGARTKGEARALSAAFEARPMARSEVGRYVLGDPPGDEDGVWVVGDGYWIERRPSAAARAGPS